jgi:hypothetical protein
MCRERRREEEMKWRLAWIFHQAGREIIANIMNNGVEQ